MGPTETTASVRVRRGQQFFRQTVLNSYGVRCCISGINVPRLLVASHIKPWRDFPKDRLDPRNGLCLSSLHDAAFDAGLITLDKDLNIVLSKRLRRYFPQETLEQNFVPFEGNPISLPEKLAEPSRKHLRYHREKIFKLD
ncbi:MAG: HNH endonuclease [Acidobacteriota bacterium]|nr:HNH endonuclease [Acidobacteriota bacterium]